MNIKWILTLVLCLGNIISLMPNLSADNLYLRENLEKTRPGDYIVIAFNNTNTVMHVYAKHAHIITIEEILVTEIKRPSDFNWKTWVEQCAPGNTQWVMYDIDLATGKMIRYYSFTKQNWYEISDNDNFLSKLLNLKLTKIPESTRKKIGPKPISGPDWRPLWQPQMIVEGLRIPGVAFDAWRTKWPRDNSELSCKTIEIYLPQTGASYFPHWLQINGVVGKAKIRVIDSGSKLRSPKPPLPNSGDQ